MAQKESKFRLWWNSSSTQGRIGSFFSLGAAVVILGALFKIMHWPGAGIMLTVGMCVEAILFMLGVFDKPHKEYEWDKVFSFDESGAIKGTVGATNPAVQQTGTGLDLGALNTVEINSLNDSIKKIANTAEQFAALNEVVKTTQDFVRNIQVLSDTTANFNASQQELNLASQKLQLSYDQLTNGVKSAEQSTESQMKNADAIAKVMASLHSSYEIQLKGVQAQVNAVTKQAENSQLIADSLTQTLEQSQKLHNSTKTASQELDKYRNSAVLLSEQIGDLNKVYGNMLNALN